MSSYYSQDRIVYRHRPAGRPPSAASAGGEDPARLLAGRRPRPCRGRNHVGGRCSLLQNARSMLCRLSLRERTEQPFGRGASSPTGDHAPDHQADTRLRRAQDRVASRRGGLPSRLFLCDLHHTLLRLADTSGRQRTLTDFTSRSPPPWTSTGT